MSDQGPTSNKIERLDSERRKDRLALQGFETRLTGLEEQLSSAKKNVKSLQSEIKRLNSLLSGTEQFDTEIAKLRVELGKMIDKKYASMGDDRLKLILNDLEQLNKSMTEMKHVATNVTQIKKELKVRKDEDETLSNLLADTKKTIDEINKQYLENQETMSLMEDSRKHETKQLGEVSAEIATLRKRSDDQRAKLDLAQDTLRKTTAKIDGFISQDEQRTTSSLALIDEFKLTQHEREKTWREWLNRLELVNKTAEEMEIKLNALDEAQRKARLSQKGLDDATIRIERRINEISEMQRLAEERARQDWGSYLTDEQKRWKNYTVSNEESLSESKRQIEKLNRRLSELEDASRLMNDVVLMLSEETQKKLQGFFELYHEWAATNADIMNRSRSR
jgi:chromosome segregation ATPase